MARVLHIEDDPRNRLLVRKLLTADGHEVIDAADGLEGVRLAITQRPDLSAANERLRDMDRLRTEFYRNISHELATPLTPIVGYLRMMVDEELGEISKPQAKALRAMDDCVRRLRSVLDNLIDVTGLET